MCSTSFYRPQTKLREGYVFTRVCDSVNRGGSASVCAPPKEQTPPREQTPRADTPSPSAVYAGRYGQQAGGTHPTGMQTC